MRKVRYENLDVYDYFLRTNQFRHSGIESLWRYEEVRKSVALYMRSGLPLAVTIIYIAHECIKQDDRSDASVFWPRFLSSLKHHAERKAMRVEQKEFNRAVVRWAEDRQGTTAPRRSSFPALKRQADHGTALSIYDFLEAELVRQLARLVEYRLDGEIPGFSKNEKPGLNIVGYPRPYTGLSSRTLQEWLNEEELQIYPASLGESWYQGKYHHIDDYIQHWIKANWDLYCEMFHDQLLHDLLAERGFVSSEPTEIQFEAERRWDRVTPFLTPDLRIRLMVMITSTIHLRLVDL